MEEREGKRKPRVGRQGGRLVELEALGLPSSSLSQGLSPRGLCI